MAFGVELPESFGTPTSTESGGGGAPAGASAPEPVSTTTPTGTQAPIGTPATPPPVDLDKLERVLFRGREVTRKEIEEWERGGLRQSDYTRKMQEVAETRKYVDNFAFDLRTVAADRSKLADFEKIYPKAFVDRAREILAQLPGQSPQPSSPSPSSLKDDPAFQEMRSEFSEWKSAQKEAEIAKLQSWVDNQFEKFAKKYPNAHAEVVNSRALSASNQGQKIDEAALEKLFQANDAEMKKRMDEMYKDKITQQLKVGKEAKDVGSGGDISGGAPKKFKSIKEATKGFLDDIAASNR